MRGTAYVDRAARPARRLHQRPPCRPRPAASARRAGPRRRARLEPHSAPRGNELPCSTSEAPPSSVRPRWLRRYRSCCELLFRGVLRGHVFDLAGFTGFPWVDELTNPQSGVSVTCRTGVPADVRSAAVATGALRRARVAGWAESGLGAGGGAMSVSWAVGHRSWHQWVTVIPSNGVGPAPKFTTASGPTWNVCGGAPNSAARWTASVSWSCMCSLLLGGCQGK